MATTYNLTTDKAYTNVASFRTTDELCLAVLYSKPAIRRAALTEIHNRIAEQIRAEGLDGHDVHDIAASVDAGELDYVGAGQKLHTFLLRVTQVIRPSAADLVDAATRTVLGW